jgi:hypothetical protein
VRHAVKPQRSSDKEENVAGDTIEGLYYVTVVFELVSFDNHYSKSKVITECHTDDWQERASIVTII